MSGSTNSYESGYSGTDNNVRSTHSPSQSMPQNMDTHNTLRNTEDHPLYNDLPLSQSSSSTTHPQTLFETSPQPTSRSVNSNINTFIANNYNNGNDTPNTNSPTNSNETTTTTTTTTTITHRPLSPIIPVSPRLPRTLTSQEQDVTITFPHTQSISYNINTNHSNTDVNNNNNNTNTNNNMNVMMIPRVGQADEDNLQLAPLPSSALSYRESPRNLPIAPYLGLLNVWRKSCILVIGYFVPATVLLILGVAIDAHHGCDAPLRIWALLQMLIQVSNITLSTYILKVIPKPSDPISEQEGKMRSAFFFYACNRLLDCVWFGWFVLGAGWVFGSSSCHQTSPALYYVSFTLIITQFLVLFIVIFFMFFSCLCIFARIRTVGNYSPRPIRYHVHPEGAPRNLVARLPTTQYRTSDETIPFEHAVCGICLGDYEIGESLRHLPCHHHFHTSCVDRWLAVRKLCPYCKHPIDVKYDPNTPHKTQSFIRLSSLPPSHRSSRSANNQSRPDDIYNLMEPRTSEHTVRAVVMNPLESGPSVLSTRTLSNITLVQSPSSTHLLHASNETDDFSPNEPQIFGAVPTSNNLTRFNSNINNNNRPPQRSLSEFSLNSINSLVSPSPSLANMNNCVSSDNLSTMLIRGTEEGDNEDVEQALSPHLSRINSPVFARFSSNNVIRISSLDMRHENQQNYSRNPLSLNGNLIFSQRASQATLRQPQFEGDDQSDVDDTDSNET